MALEVLLRKAELNRDVDFLREGGAHPESGANGGRGDIPRGGRGATNGHRSGWDSAMANGKGDNV